MKFKELIDATDETLQDQLSNHKDEFAIKMRLIKENMADDNKKITKDLIRMKEEVFKSIEMHVSNLSNDKLSRESMAQMLLDVAMKLQGTSVNSLRDLQRTVEEKDSGK